MPIALRNEGYHLGPLHDAHERPVQPSYHLNGIFERPTGTTSGFSGL